MTENPETPGTVNPPESEPDNGNGDADTQPIPPEEAEKQDDGGEPKADVPEEELEDEGEE